MLGQGSFQCIEAEEQIAGSWTELSDGVIDGKLGNSFHRDITICMFEPWRLLGIITTVKNFSSLLLLVLKTI